MALLYDFTMVQARVATQKDNSGIAKAVSVLDLATVQSALATYVIKSNKTSNFFWSLEECWPWQQYILLTQRYESISLLHDLNEQQGLPRALPSLKALWWSVLLHKQPQQISTTPVLRMNCVCASWILYFSQTTWILSPPLYTNE